ncbi:hypothetical protein BC332_23030 [Capsicum chinense]|nr:hypothetical protein BC332_23030 [Capsicum chinense]
MSTSRTCNNSLWTKEETKIFENTLEIYFNDANLFTKMEEALPWKSLVDIKDHYNILIEDIDVIESGRVTLPDYPEEPRDSNQNSEASIGWRRGAFWSEEEHRRTSVPPFMVSYP